jgi:hypothetical protein
MTMATRDPDSFRDSLRLAAKAADRAKAAEPLWPAFEARLTELGYSPMAIAHAFETLKGAGTVDEALAELKENARLDRIGPTRLEFEVVENEPALPAGRALTITTVERDGRGIRIAYEIRPRLLSPPRPPKAEARDDCENTYRGLGGSIGSAGSLQRTTTLGSVTVPLPPPQASMLRVRMSWATGSTSLWDDPAHETRITL